MPLPGQGSGQPVVFSYRCSLSVDAWEDQMEFLGAHGYRCIGHDRHGRWTPSTMIRASVLADPSQFFKDLAALIIRGDDDDQIVPIGGASRNRTVVRLGISPSLNRKENRS